MVMNFEVQSQWRLLILIAFFAGGWGCGLWVTSWYYDFVPGMFIALFLVAVVKTGAHLAFLGRPERFIKAFLNPRTSWLSRGLIGITLFLATALLYVGPYLLSWLPWHPTSTIGSAFGVASVASSIFVMLYTGYLMAYSPAIPFWNTPILPFAFLFYSAEAGVATAIPLLLFFERYIDEKLELVKIVLILIILLIVGGYVYGASQSVEAAKVAVRLLLKGRLAPLFYLGVIVIGLLLPLANSLLTLLGATFTELTAMSAVFSITGGIFFRWCILLAGVYHPIEWRV
ncbi:MAG: NrfD/PsrC family molybdoenzyme membrane anchor subunit [Nitrososphaeria archaeon]